MGISLTFNRKLSKIYFRAKNLVTCPLSGMVSRVMGLKFDGSEASTSLCIGIAHAFFQV